MFENCISVAREPKTFGHGFEMKLHRLAAVTPRQAGAKLRRSSETPLYRRNTGAVIRERSIQLGTGYRLFKESESAFFPGLGSCFNQGSHCGSIERGGETDSFNTGFNEFGNAEGLSFNANHEVNRL